jgi:hypothetical protein
MAKFSITSPDGQTFEVNAPDGATEADAIKYVQDNLLSETKTRGPMREFVRQSVGLPVRYAAQGLAGTAGLVVDPINALINEATGAQIKPLRSATQGLLDSAGLPKAETSRERNVQEASEMVTGTGGIIKSAVGKGMQAIAARPGLQAISSASAGYAGNEVREEGGSPAEQFGASFLAGVGAPIGFAAMGNSANNVARNIKNALNPKLVEQQADDAIRQAGINPETLPPDALNRLRLDAQNAVKTGDITSPDALSRLADYRALNATPMRGNLTLNPVDITRDKNLAKIGANSRDPAQQSLAEIQYDNNRQLINSLNELGANTTDDIYGAGQKVISALDHRDRQARDIISQFYNKARATDGRSANIDPRTFTETANNYLDEGLLGGALPEDIRNKLNSIAQGKTPLTVDVAEQLKTNMGNLQRASSDGQARMAIGKVRQALDEAPLLNNQGQDAIDAFNTARRLNASYMRNVENTPALKAVRDGIDPDKFVQQFIIGSGSKSNVMDVAMLKKNIKGNPEATTAIRNQILSHLKSKGLSGAADEVGNFSTSGYSSALNSIGERKLKLFFDKNEIEQLKRIGRVSSLENVQPRGSAVNNSNTAGAAFSSALDVLGKYLPLGLDRPVNSANTFINARASMNAPKALVVPKEKMPLLPAFNPVGLTGIGLLSTED